MTSLAHAAKWFKTTHPRIMWSVFDRCAPALTTKDDNEAHDRRGKSYDFIGSCSEVVQNHASTDHVVRVQLLRPSANDQRR
jgi:hypothetical protein